MAKKTPTSTEKPASKPKKTTTKSKTTTARSRRTTSTTKKATTKKKKAPVKPPKSREEIEYERLNQLYIDIPANKRSLVDGLIHQAARLRVQLDDLWEDIKLKGTVEEFQQKNDGVTFNRERPESKIFIQSDKNYLAIIKKLDEMLPAKEAKTGFSKLDD